MVFLNKRNTLVATLLALIAGVLFAGPPLAGRMIEQSLDLPRIKQIVTRGVKSQTNLLLSIQGTRFDPYQGVIFSGVHGSVEDEKGRSHFLIESENAVLTISYWKLLRGEFPIEELVIHEGRLNPMNLHRFAWNTETQEPDEAGQANDEARPAPGQGGWNAAVAGQIPDDMDFRTAARLLKLRIVRMDLMLPPALDRRLNPKLAHGFLQLNLDAVPEPTGDAYRITAGIVPPDNSPTQGEVHLNGQWVPGGPRELDVRFDDLSSELLPALGMVYPVIPPDIRRVLRSFTLKSGLIQGTGTLDFSDEAITLQAEGRYNDLNLMILTPSQASLMTRDAGGDFKFTGRFPGIDEPEALRLELNQPGLEMDLEYSEEDDPEIKRRGRERRIQLSGRLELSKDSDATLFGYVLGGPVYGQVDLKSDMSFKKNADIIPEFELGLKDLEIELSEKMYGRPGRENSARFVVNSGRATQSDGDLVFKADGSILEFPFQLSGDGDIRFDMITFRDKRTRDLTQDLDMDVIVSDVAYGDLALIVSRIYTRIMTSGTAKNAPKAEDGGPLYKLSFSRRFLYKGFLKPLEISADIILKKRKDPGEIMPDDLEIELYKKHGYAELKIPTQRSDNAKVYYRYQLNFDDSMPRHEMLLELYLKNNRYVLPQVLGSDRPPGYFEMTYSYRGHGWFPYDLIHWSFSSMYLDMEDVTLGDVAPFNIIRHSLDLPGAEYKLDRMRFTRSTNTRDVDFRNIRLQSSELDIDGSGSVELPADGSLKLSYEYQPEGAEDETRGRLRLKLSEQGQWIPTSD